MRVKAHRPSPRAMTASGRDNFRCFHSKIEADIPVTFRTDGGRKAFIQRKDDKSKSVLVISALTARPGVDKCLMDPVSWS